MLIRIVPVLCVACVMCGSTNKVAELSSFRSSQHSGSENMHWKLLSAIYTFSFIHSLRRSVVVCVSARVLACYHGSTCVELLSHLILCPLSV